MHDIYSTSNATISIYFGQFADNMGTGDTIG
jgi:hypothetical protein